MNKQQEQFLLEMIALALERDMPSSRRGDAKRIIIKRFNELGNIDD